VKRSGVEPHGTVLGAVVAHAGVMPVALEVARAFAEAGMLERYETTFAYRPERAFDRAMGRVARRVLGARVEPELQRRAIPELAGAHVQRSPAWDGLRVLASRLGAGDVVADRLWERMTLAFDAGVARRLRPNTRLVYGFEHGCHATFARARELGVATVLDMAAPHHAFAQRVLAEQVARFPELRTEYWQATQPLARERNARKQAEQDLADLVIANSTFTARSLVDTGLPASRVRVVSLAAPPVDRSWRSAARCDTRTLLFAGAVSPHKGAHLLLEAWAKLGEPAGAELLLAGGWALPERLRTPLPAGVRWLGRVPRAELFAQYTRATALVLPSLGDGFGLVVTEALAHGLPVIATRSAGAADLIEEGRNGWVLDSGDVDALAERMQWCLDHPRELHAMREAAELSALQRPWSKYRADLLATVCAYLEGRPHA
jgi:glycosyltransferase involved in cell wall biosynthesis